MKKSLLSTAMLLSASMGFSNAANAEKVTFNVIFPPNHYMRPAFQEWADDVSAATHGEVEMVFPPNSLAPPPGVMDAVRNGVADAGFVFNGFIAKSAPATLLSQMPWVHNGDSEAVSVAMWDTYQKYFSEKESHRGVHLLSIFNLGPAVLCSVTDSPISSLEDFQKRKIWALPGTIANTFKEMDLSVVAGPAVQAHELISRNTVDAHMGLTTETTVGFKVAPYTKSCLDMNIHMQSANFSIFFNQRLWDKLSPETQSSITNLSGAALAARLGKATNAAESQARKYLESQGVEFVQPPKDLLAELERASGKIEAAWVDAVSKKYGVDVDQAMKDLKTEIKNYKK